MLWKYLQRSFGGGVIDKELSGRQDLAKYFQGASKIKNLLVRRQGNLQKRRGTDRVAGLKHLLGCGNDGNDIAIGKMRMIPVERDDDGQFLLMTGGCAFVGNRDGILLCNGDRVRTSTPTTRSTRRASGRSTTVSTRVRTGSTPSASCATWALAARM